MTTDELISSITCLCVEGVEFMGRCELAAAILTEIEKYQNSQKVSCSCYFLNKQLVNIDPICPYHGEYAI